MEDQQEQDVESAVPDNNTAVDVDVNVDAQAQTAGQPQQEAQQAYHLPPGYGYDPASGKVFLIGPATPQAVQPNPEPVSAASVAAAPVAAAPVAAAPVAAAPVIAAHPASTQGYGQVVHSVEQFLEGEATVSDVVKTLYTNTAQDDQLWKGMLVGAAAAVLLTSEPIRKSMGQTLGGVFPGLKQSKQTQQTASTAATTDKKPPTESPIPEK